MSTGTGALHVRTIAGLLRGIRDGEFSARELTETLLERIAANNERLNAFITVTGEQALASAEAADRAQAGGKAPLLNGLPIVHKDLFCTRGVRTTCGSRILGNFVSPYDATVVERLKNAGAVMLGKTNMDEFAMGSSNETSWFGPVANPWDLGRSPGGSSGGSAAAVAARLVPAATGTDTGGSIRQPAALTGYGRAQADLRQGLALRHGGVRIQPRPGRGDHAQRGRCRACCSAHRGLRRARFDLRRSPGPRLRRGARPAAQRREDRHRAPAFRRGPRPAGAPRACKMRSSVMRSEGASLVEVDLPNLDSVVPTYYVVAPAECSSNMSRFDGVRFGHRADRPERPARPLLPQSRRRIRRRGQAPHHDRYLRLIGGLLRRLLSQGAESAAAHREDFRNAFGEVTSSPGRRRRRRHSRSARKPTTRSRCT